MPEATREGEQAFKLASLATEDANVFEPSGRGWPRFQRYDDALRGRRACRVKALHCVRADEKLWPIEGSEFKIDADLVLLAMGFVSPMHEGLITELEVDLDLRGNVKANELDYRTSRPKVFAAGDMRRGQSLVVWAIREGRQAAHAIDKALMGRTELPR